MEPVLQSERGIKHGPDLVVHSAIQAFVFLTVWMAICQPYPERGNDFCSPEWTARKAIFHVLAQKKDLSQGILLTGVMWWCTSRVIVLPRRWSRTAEGLVYSQRRTYLKSSMFFLNPLLVAWYKETIKHVFAQNMPQLINFFILVYGWWTDISLRVHRKDPSKFERFLQTNRIMMKYELVFVLSIKALLVKMVLVLTLKGSIHIQTK